MHTIKTWMKDTISFCRQNQSLCTAIFLMVYLLHGKHAFTTNSLYDTDDVIYFPGSVLNWLEIGRQGNAFTKKVFGLMWFNPYFAGALCLVLFPAVVILLCRIFWQAGIGKNRLSLWVFAMAFIASPVWVYQFYFTVQWFEIVWALFLVVFTAALFQMMFSVDGWYRKGKRCKPGLFVLETLLLVWAFASYQAFVPLFLALCAGVYLIRLSSSAGRFAAGEELRRLAWMAGVFLAAFVCNTVVTNRFFMPDDYLTGQVVWGVRETKEILRCLAVYFVKSHLGLGVQYSWLMGVGAVFAALLVLRVLFFEKKAWMYKALYAASMAVVWAAAHMLTVYVGTETVIRSQLAYPFVMAFLLMFVLEQTGREQADTDVSLKKQGMNADIDAGLKKQGMQADTCSSLKKQGMQADTCSSLKKRCMCLALAFAAAAGIWGQLGDTFRLWYTEDMKDKMDMAVVQKVISQVDQLGLGTQPQLPVVFVGDYSPQVNRACFDTDADLSIGVSCWERVNEQPNRLVRMIENHFGVCWQRADWESIMHAREISRDMPSYPDEGYVQVRDGVIIIKMSDNYG